MERMSEIVEKLNNYSLFCTRSVKSNLMCRVAMQYVFAITESQDD